jgi:hypothetical protein
MLLVATLEEAETSTILSNQTKTLCRFRAFGCKSCRRCESRGGTKQRSKTLGRYPPASRLTARSGRRGGSHRRHGEPLHIGQEIVETRHGGRQSERKTEPAGSYPVVITARLCSHRDDTKEQQPGSCLDRNCCDERSQCAACQPVTRSQ